MPVKPHLYNNKRILVVAGEAPIQRCQRDAAWREMIEAGPQSRTREIRAATTWLIVSSRRLSS